MFSWLSDIFVIYNSVLLVLKRFEFALLLKQCQSRSIHSEAACHAYIGSHGWECHIYHPIRFYLYSGSRYLSTIMTFFFVVVFHFTKEMWNQYFDVPIASKQNSLFLFLQALNEYAVILSSPSISTRSSVITLHAMLW